MGKTNLEQLFSVGKEVKLADGELVHIKPWTVKQQSEIMPDILGLLDKRGSESFSLKDFLNGSVTDMANIVCLTLGKPRSWIDDRPVEDLLVLAQEVFQVCVYRVDGDEVGGVLGKAMALAGITPEAIAGAVIESLREKTLTKKS
jgi:hypothetical protein